MLDTMFFRHAFDALNPIIKEELGIDKEVDLVCISIEGSTMAFIDKEDITDDKYTITVNEGCNDPVLDAIDDTNKKILMCASIIHEHKHISQLENKWTIDKTASYKDRDYEIDADDYAWDFIGRFKDKVFSIIDAY